MPERDENNCVGRRPDLPNRSGYSLLELLVVLGLISILTGFATAKLTKQNGDLDNAASQTAGFIRQVRARAISTTKAYLVEKADSNHLVAKQSSSCADDLSVFTVDSYVSLEVHRSVQITSLDQLCVTPRGLLDEPSTVSLAYKDASHAQSIEIGMAGSMRFTKW